MVKESTTIKVMVEIEIDALQAAILSEKLKHLDHWLSKRIEVQTIIRIV